MIATPCHAQSHELKIASTLVMQSQLETAIAFDQMPWLLPALLQLEDLQATGTEIPGIGDLRIAADTATHTRQLFSRITLKQLEAPKLSPISGGGVGISFAQGQKEVTFTIFPDESDIGYMLTNESDEIVKDGLLTVDRQNQINSSLKWLSVS